MLDIVKLSCRILYYYILIFSIIIIIIIISTAVNPVRLPLYESCISRFSDSDVSHFEIRHQPVYHGECGVQLVPGLVVDMDVEIYKCITVK